MRQILSLLLVAAFLPATFGAARVRQVPLGLALFQPGSPVSIVQGESTEDYIFERVGVKNTSDRLVTSVTFGLMFISTDDKAQSIKPKLFTARPVATNLRPGEEASLSAYVLPYSEIFERASELNVDSVMAQLGLLRVEFADGTAWLAERSADGGFLVNAPKSARGPQGVSAGRCSGDRSGSAQRDALPNGGILKRARFMQVHFTCKAESSCIYCSNSYTSCTVNTCPVSQTGCTLDCPHQTCAPSQ